MKIWPKGGLIGYEELRREAIKWAKNADSENSQSEYICARADGVVKFIQEFFDVADKEL